MNKTWERRIGWAMVFFPLFIWSTTMFAAIGDAAVVPVTQRTRTAIAAVVAILAAVALMVMGGKALTYTASQLTIMQPRHDTRATSSS
jgi:hypothetical protein